MNIFKQYLRNWGDSLTYSDRNARTEITAENIEGNYYRFTMPFEGIVMLEGRAGADGLFQCHLWGDIDPWTTGIDSNVGSPFGVRCIGRYRKGQIVRYVLSGFNEMHVYAYRLTGGDNRLLSSAQAYIRGGSICLNSSNIFKPMVSLLDYQFHLIRGYILYHSDQAILMKLAPKLLHLLQVMHKFALGSVIMQQLKTRLYQEMNFLLDLAIFGVVVLRTAIIGVMSLVEKVIQSLLEYLLLKSKQIELLVQSYLSRRQIHSAFINGEVSYVI